MYLPLVSAALEPAASCAGGLVVVFGLVVVGGLVVVILFLPEIKKNKNHPGKKGRKDNSIHRSLAAWLCLRRNIFPNITEIS